MTVPSSWMSIEVPVSSVSARMTAPPLPITSRIFSGLILNVIHARRVLRDFRTGCGIACCIAPECAAGPRAPGQRDRHDLLGDALDLDVHLQRGDAAIGAGDLEVHVTQVIFVTEDVGQHREAVAFLDEAHRDAREVRLQRHAGVHERQARRRRRDAIDEEPFDSVISETTRIE